MQKIILSLFILAASISVTKAQDIIKGLPITISLVPKSVKQPNLKLKDGSGIFLVYKADDGIHVILGKNGKQTDFCNPIENTKMVQVGEVDIEKDGKNEVVVANRTSATTIEILIFKKADFETMYKEWSSFTGSTAVEFPGDGTVKLYDQSGKAGVYKFEEDGKIAEL